MAELQDAFERDEDPLSAPPKGRRYTPESVGGLLKLFFRSLPNPAFPLKLYATFVKVGWGRPVMMICGASVLRPRLTRLPLPKRRQIGQLQDKSRRIVELKETLANYVPPAHANVLRVLMPFLLSVSEHADVNKMTIDNLALVFGPTLLRPNSLTVGLLSLSWSGACRWRGAFVVLLSTYPRLADTAPIPRRAPGTAV